MKIRPQRTLLLVSKVDTNLMLDTKSGLMLDDVTGSPGMTYGIIESKGPDVTDRFHEQDKIIFHARMAVGLQILSKRYFLVEQGEIFAILEEEPEKDLTPVEQAVS